MALMWMMVLEWQLLLGTGNPFYFGAGTDPINVNQRYYADASIAELVVYLGDDHTASQRNRIESYLALKYGSHWTRHRPKIM